MRKKASSLLIAAALSLALLAGNVLAADTAVPFPGAGDLNGANPGEGGIYVKDAEFYAQAFNVKQAFKGFKYAGYGTNKERTVKYEIFHYRTDLAASRGYEPAASGTFKHLENNLDQEILFGKELAAGKYVLVFTTVSGEGYFAPCIRPGTEFTESACSEEMQLVDFGFFTFDILAGDPAVMVGGLIFGESADAGVYLKMSEDPVNPPPETEAPVNPPDKEDPDKEDPGKQDPGKQDPGKTDTPKTGDVMMIVPVAAACVAATVLLLKKRQEA